MRFIDRPVTPGRRFSIKEVARVLGVTSKAVSHWIEQGWLTCSKPREGVYRIRMTAVRKMLRTNVHVAKIYASALERQALKRARGEL